MKFRGQELIGARTDNVARAGIAFCPEERAIFASLSVIENLLLPPASPAAGWRSRRSTSCSPTSRSAAAARGPALRRRAADARHCRILRTGARFLLLDEPTEGLAPVIVHQIGRMIRSIRARGFTIVLVEQNVRFAAALADRHYIVEQGKVIDAIPGSTVQATLERLQASLRL